MPLLSISRKGSVSAIIAPICIARSIDPDIKSGSKTKAFELAEWHECTTPRRQATWHATLSYLNIYERWVNILINFALALEKP
jgi:hypothetical protein